MYGEIHGESLINLSIVTASSLQKMCDSPQSLPYKGPSISAEWRGWFSGLVVRHLTCYQEIRVRFPAEHLFTHFLCCIDFCFHHTLLINTCQKSL